MSDKKLRLRRCLKIRSKFQKNDVRLSVFRSLKHIYAQLIQNGKVLASASSKEEEIANQVNKKNNKITAALVGKHIAWKAQKIQIEKVVFDRSGFQFHGRVAALANAARENGLIF
jgi:large subunit ribosomal protein L18